jgi:hypothetical protein
VPFLRVIRDKRGYETTYLLDWVREGTRQRSKVLYVFRTPAGVRVGREPLEPEVRSQLEAHHPNLTFQWDSVRDTMQVIETAPERRRRPKATSTPRVTPVHRAPRDGGVAPWPVPAVIAGDTPDERVAFLSEWYRVAREQIGQRPMDPRRREALLRLAERLNPAAWTDADETATGIEGAAAALDRLSRAFTTRLRRPQPGSDAPPAPRPDADLPAEPQ